MRAALRALATMVAFLAVVLCGGGSGAVLVFTGDGAQIVVGVVAVLANVIAGICLMFVGLSWAFADQRRGRHG